MDTCSRRPKVNTKITFDRLAFPVLLAFVSCLNYSVNAESIEQPYITAEKVAAIEKYVNQGMKKLEVPGLAVAIVESGKSVFAKGYGVANQQGHPVSVNTSFDTGSISKSFTGVMIAQLSDEGKIDVDQPVVKYIPWFKSKDKSKSDLILVKHLLSHQSGFSTLAGNRNLNSDDNSDDALNKAVSELAEIELIALPGESFQYSNVNYHVLGHLIESIEGDSYENVIERRIFKALGMNDSYVQTKSKQVSNPSQGFIFKFGDRKITDYKMARDTLGSGGLFSSVADISLYLTDLLRRQSLLVSSEIKQRIISPTDSSESYGYGFGWFVSQYEDHSIIYHPGMSYGYQSVTAFSPELDMAFVVLTNTHSGFGTRNVRALLRGVGDIILGKQPANTEPPIIEKVMFWLVFVLAALIIIAACLFISKYKKGLKQPIKKPFATKEITIRFILPSLFLLSVVYFLLVLIPNYFGINLQTFSLSEPNGFFGAMLTSSIAFLWFIVRSSLLFKSVKPKQELAG